MSDLAAMQHRAMEVANHYDELNRRVGRKGWDARDYADGLVGDTGDLMKAVMAVHGRRDMPHAAANVEHELNDILWSLLMLYYFFRLDPAKSFTKAMDELEQRIVTMKREAA